MTIGLARLSSFNATIGFAAMLAMAALVTSCGRNEPAPVLTLGVPGLVNEHVSAASDGGSLVAVTWSASSASTGTNIFAAVSADGGRSFSTPTRVNAVDRQANVNGEQPPRVVVARERDGSAAIVVLWTAKGENGTALLSARSTDGGHTFAASTPMPGVDAPGNRGWESLATGGNGELYALWLDHRDTVRARAGQAMHQHEHDGEAGAAMDGASRAQRSQLFVGALDGTLAPRSVARGVCYCCKTALAIGAEGAIYAAWRHVYEGNRRDIAFTVSRDGGRSFEPPVRVSEDQWQLDGCPENGPALGVDVHQRIHVVWPTLVRRAGEETLALFHASSADGRDFSPRAALPTSGAAYHPQLVVTPDGGLLVAWDELEGGQRRVKVARGRPGDGGVFGFAPVVLGEERLGAYPAVAGAAGHAVIAWARRGDDGATIAVTRLPY
jgi:hypothetical protein